MTVEQKLQKDYYSTQAGLEFLRKRQGAVSYTHLDVYKRQVSTLARSRVTNYATIAFVMFVSSLVSSTCYIIHDSGASVNSNFKFF